MEEIKIQRTEHPAAKPDPHTLGFGKSKEEMRPSDSYAISAIMVRIEGWEKCGARQMLPIYGRQRVYTRTT